MTPKWKKAGPDGEMEIKFPTGRRFRVEKQYDENIRHKGEWKVMEWDTRSRDWEWGDTYSPKAYAKEMAMKQGQYKNGKKVADYSSMFKFESVQENFQDGRNPQDKGDSARHGIAKKSSISALKKIRSSPTASKRKKQLAHWQINMRKGKQKNEDVAAVNTGSIPNPATTVMGPRPKEINVTDRRRKKNKLPVLLKRFRKYVEDNG